MRFSIILPAHNAEGYIRKALDSIACQTFIDYELIVICDACTDKTEDIAREYGAKVLTVNYSQAGQTRNAGLDVAQGEWVLFMDDDDWWIHEYVLAMLDSRLGAEDVLRFGFIWKGTGYAPCGNWYAVWNKAWKREFIGNTRFPDWDRADDVGFHEDMMAKKPRFQDWDMPFYYYNYMRPGSQQWQKAHNL